MSGRSANPGYRIERAALSMSWLPLIGDPLHVELGTECSRATWPNASRSSSALAHCRRVMGPSRSAALAALSLRAARRHRPSDVRGHDRLLDQPGLDQHARYPSLSLDRASRSAASSTRLGSVGGAEEGHLAGDAALAASSSRAGRSVPSAANTSATHGSRSADAIAMSTRRSAGVLLPAQPLRRSSRYPVPGALRIGGLHCPERTSSRTGRWGMTCTSSSSSR